MTDAVLVFPPGFRVLDASGNPVSGAKIKFFEAGTSTPKTVYSNQTLGASLGSTVYTRSDGYPVASSGSSTTVLVFTGTALYKVQVTDASDVDIFPVQDNVKGAVDTSTFVTTGSASTINMSVVNTSGPSLSVTTSHKGKKINANTSGGNVTLTLDAAATLGDGWNCEVRKAHASNVVIIKTSNSESIGYPGSSGVALGLVFKGEAVAIRCDGTAFIVGPVAPPLMQAPGVIQITDRVTSAPAGPTAGARYIVTAAYSSFSQEQIIEYDGVSAYNTYTPPTDCGWLAYVLDEDAYYSFQGTGWLCLSATQAQMEAKTATGVFATPANLHMHPAAAKVWGLVTVSGGTPTLAVSHNVTSITDTGTGILTVTIATDFSSTAYAVDVSAEFTATTGRVETVGTKTGLRAAGTIDLAGYTTVSTGDSTKLALDVAAWSFQMFGDQ